MITKHWFEIIDPEELDNDNTFILRHCVDDLVAGTPIKLQKAFTKYGKFLTPIDVIELKWDDVHVYLGGLLLNVKI